jgi:sarcosine oxidase delta subunit
MIKMPMITTTRGKDGAANTPNFAAGRMFARNTFILPQVAPLPDAKEIVAAETTPQEKPKMTWGEPTWFLLHTLAEKVKPEFFPQIRESLLNLIYSVCSCLPCPECAEHAKKYLMTTGKIRQIRTQEDLKMMLFEFHNYVNMRKKYAAFSVDELREKYARANTTNIIRNFIAHFQEKSNNPNLLSAELYRHRVLTQMTEWFQDNIHFFN